MTDEERIDEIKHILGHCPGSKHVCWYSEKTKQLEKDFPNDDHTQDMALGYMQQQALLDIITEARKNENRLARNCIGDLHMERIGVPDIDDTTHRAEKERQAIANLLDMRLAQLSNNNNAEEVGDDQGGTVQ